MKAWLLGRRNPRDDDVETEFLNTRDGYELARFAQAHFSGDAEAQRAHPVAAAEEVEINALLAEGNALPVVYEQVAASSAPAVAAPLAPAAASSTPVVPAAPAPAPVAPPPSPVPQHLDEDQVDLALRYLEILRERGLSVETLAEALLIIENREERQRRAKSGA